MGQVVRNLLMAMLCAVTLNASAATSTFIVTGLPTLPSGTITVVQTTTSAPWYERSEVLGLLGPLVALTIGLLAAFLAFRQIDRQRRNTSELQVENKRNEFKLEIYREFSKALDATVESLGSAGMYVISAAGAADAAKHLHSMGVTPSPLSYDGQELSAKCNEASRQVSDVIMLIERYLVVEPDLDIFRLALNVAMHDMTELQTKLVSEFFKWFPLKRPEGSTIGPEIVNVRILPEEVIEQLRRMGWEFHSRTTTVGSYLDDLRRELQVLLLHGLFSGALPKRQPIDPQHLVITLEKGALPQLRKHLMEETAWGRNATKIQEEVREHLRQKQVAQP